jgi:PRTRC genetic system protein C
MPVTPLKRVFKLGDQNLPDPNPKFTEKAVMEFYANQYPELTNASIGVPEYEGNQVIYEFKTVAGTKG